MKKINNGFKNYYYLTESGTVFNNKTGNYLKSCSHHSYKLRLENDTFKSISIKELYKLVYGKVFCDDTIENLDGEIWKPIENTDDIYWISNKGRVKSLADYKAKILRPVKNHGGYDRVTIVQDKVRLNKLVSRLVAAAFLMPPNSVDMELHHINRIRSDNRVENLVWLSPADHKKIHQQIKKEAAAKEEIENVSA